MNGRNRVCSPSAPSLCLPCARGSVGRGWCSGWLFSLPEGEERGGPTVVLGLFQPQARCALVSLQEMRLHGLSLGHLHQLSGLGHSKSVRGPRMSTYPYFCFPWCCPLFSVNEGRVFQCSAVYSSEVS